MYLNISKKFQNLRHRGGAAGIVVATDLGGGGF
jgi:hypothetical protein